MNIAIGIPTLNRADLLQENLADLAETFNDADALHIIDNGNQAISIPEKLHPITFLETVPTNLGVAGSWNKIMRRAFIEGDADYVLILNDDIVLGKTRDIIEEIIISKAEPWLLTGHYFWSVLLISKRCFEEVGEFDEKFFPAYYEDNDYAHRVTLHPDAALRMGQDPRLDPIVKRNSMTIEKDKTLNKDFNKNKAYFVEKWGGLPGQVKFKNPFNQ